MEVEMEVGFSLPFFRPPLPFFRPKRKMEGIRLPFSAATTPICYRESVPCRGRERAAALGSAGVMRD